MGGYMWPVMPIFELGRAFLDKSHVWKFGLDWLRLSRVIVVTNKKKITDGAQFNILTEFSFHADKKYKKKTEGHKADYSPSTPNKKASAPILNFCSSIASTIMLGSSFHNLVVAGMKHLEYWEVWNLTGEKDKLLILKEPLITLLGQNKLGSSEWRGWKGLWKIL